MIIRQLKRKDIDAVVNIWYETSIIAHNFIPKEYWEKNKSEMASKYLPNSETYIAVKEENIVGFVSMAENFLAAIFVDSNVQGKGIGKSLLNFVKGSRTTIQLKVYKKNIKTIDFYCSQGFKTISESLEEVTDEKELLMEWKKE